MDKIVCMFMGGIRSNYRSKFENSFTHKATLFPSDIKGYVFIMVKISLGCSRRTFGILLLCPNKIVNMIYISNH